MAEVPPPPRGDSGPASPKSSGSHRSVIISSSDAETKRPITRETLKEESLNLVGNGVAELKSLWQDFRRSNRFFKYKAGILVAYLALCVTSIGLSCPSRDYSNDLRARLIETEAGAEKVYKVQNDSTEPWLQVTVAVNGTWRTTADRVLAGEGVKLASATLIDESGAPMPRSTTITKVEVFVGSDHTLLMEGGSVIH